LTINTVGYKLILGESMRFKVNKVYPDNCCPTCGSESIKYGIQEWHRKGEPDKIQRWQRYQCKKNKHLWYSYLETVLTFEGGRNSKPESSKSASLTSLTGVGGSAKIKETKDNELERNDS
jgi:hypothetical protein